MNAPEVTGKGPVQTKKGVWVCIFCIHLRKEIIDGVLRMVCIESGKSVPAEPEKCKVKP